MNGKTPEPESENPEIPPVESEPPQMVFCQRCGRFSPANAALCLFCRAPSRDPKAGGTATIDHVEAEESASRFSALFWSFAAMLLVNVLLSWYAKGIPDESPMPEHVVRNHAMALTVAEIVDAGIVIFAFLTLRSTIRPAPGVGNHRRLALLLALPLLALLLAANIGYHWALITIAGIRPEADGMMSSGHHQLWLLVLYSVQPAIIEELFCRRLSFDFFTHHTTVGTAAFASAAMFAAMHTGALVSAPYFVLFGFVMAWLRWWSGSLVLPISLHFAHNLLISIHELATT